MALALLQSVINTTVGTVPVTTTVAHPTAGNLLAVWVYLHGTGAPGTSTAITDNGSNTGWNLTINEHLVATANFRFAWRVATATDHTSLTTVTVSDPGSSGYTECSLIVLEFSGYTTWTEDPNSPAQSGNGSTAVTTISPIPCVTTGSTHTTPSLYLCAVTMSTTVGAFGAWGTSNAATLPAPTAITPTGTGTIAPILDFGWATTLGSVAATDGASITWTTPRICQSLGVAFYDGTTSGGFTGTGARGATMATSLNVLAGVTGYDAQGAANIWAGTKNLDLLGALNHKNGTRGLGRNLVCNQLAGTTNLDAPAALSHLALLS